MELSSRRCILPGLVSVLVAAAAPAHPASARVWEETPQDQPARRVQPSMEPRVDLLDESFPYDEANPAIGSWHGNVMTGFGVPAASLRITRTDDGGYAMIGTVAPGNRPHRVIKDFEIDGRSVRFAFPVDPPEMGKMIFLGEVSEDAQRVRGRIIMPDAMIDREIKIRNMDRVQANLAPIEGDERTALEGQLRAGRFELGRSPLPMMLSNPRAYAGEILIAEVAFQINLVFAETPGGNWVGHIDIPSQVIAEWRLDKVKREGDHIIAHMGGGSPAVYDGTISEDSTTFAGTYRQGNTEIPFKFHRLADYSVPEFDEIARYGAAMFDATDVTIEHPHGHYLAGTLLLPRTGDPVAAAVLLSARGPHDRNNTIFGHRTFEIVAEYLAQRGVAVLRYDDRGVGKSSGRFQTATIEDFASDALAAYNSLRTIDRIDPRRIGFIGHDEGATVAALAATRAQEPAFVVMLAGSGVPGYELELARTDQTLRQRDDLEDALKERMLNTQRALFEAFLRRDDDDLLMNLAVKAVEAEFAVVAALGDAPPAAPEPVAARRLAVMRQPAMSFYLQYNPLIAIRSAACPILAVWGSLDRASPPDLSLPPIREALAAGDAQLTATVYTGLNHLFQPATTGGPDEYRKIPVSMYDQMLADIVTWIEEIAPAPDVGIGTVGD